jgi:hypothetical protein
LGTGAAAFAAGADGAAGKVAAGGGATVALGGWVRSGSSGSVGGLPVRCSATAGPYSVGYCRPPLYTHFRPGQSGNPSGRVKNSKNLKTLFHQILNEQIPLQDGTQTKKVTKAEALMRRLVIGALKGDRSSLMALMCIAKQTGEFADDAKNEQLVIRWVE